MSIFSSPTFENCSFIGNWAAETSGALGAGIDPYWDDPSNITLIDCLFSGNSCGQLSPGAIGFGTGIRLEATRCVFAENEGGDSGGAIYQGCNSGGTGRETTLILNECTFVDNSAGGPGGAILSNGCGECMFMYGCTFVGNEAPSGGSIRFGNASAVAVIQNTIVAFNPASEGISGVEGVTIDLSCSDVFGNAGGDYVGPIEGMNGVSANFSMDPLFCDRANLEFTLHENSPCAPGNHPDDQNDCGLIGAHPTDCGATPVEVVSWGEVKSRFKE